MNISIYLQKYLSTALPFFIKKIKAVCSNKNLKPQNGKKRSELKTYSNVLPTPFSNTRNLPRVKCSSWEWQPWIPARFHPPLLEHLEWRCHQSPLCANSSKWKWNEAGWFVDFAHSFIKPDCNTPGARRAEPEWRGDMGAACFAEQAQRNWGLGQSSGLLTFPTVECVQVYFNCTLWKTDQIRVANAVDTDHHRVPGTRQEVNKNLETERGLRRA